MSFVGRLGGTGQAQVIPMSTLGAMLQATGAIPGQATGYGAASGGGLWSQTLSATPTTANSIGTSWYNQVASSTVANGTAGVNIYLPSNSTADVISALQISAPAAPYSLSVLLSWVTTDLNNPPLFGFSDGTKFQGWFFGAAKYGIYTFSNHNTTVGYTTYEGNKGILPVNLAWWKILDDGTNIKFFDSPDGAFWRQFYSATYAGGYIGARPTKVILGGDAYDGAIYLSLLSWTQGTS